jgi:hypothetical protein
MQPRLSTYLRKRLAKVPCWDVDVFCVSYKEKTCLFNKHITVEFVETGLVIKSFLFDSYYDYDYVHLKDYS